jgi:hypothetical protein
MVAAEVNRPQTFGFADNYIIIGAYANSIQKYALEVAGPGKRLGKNPLRPDAQIVLRV